MSTVLILLANSVIVALLIFRLILPISTLLQNTLSTWDVQKNLTLKIISLSTYGHRGFPGCPDDIYTLISLIRRWDGGIEINKKVVFWYQISWILQPYSVIECLHLSTLNLLLAKQERKKWIGGNCAINGATITQRKRSIVVKSIPKRERRDPLP